MNVLVLCGGRSAERDVSCISAAAILRNLNRRRRALLVWIDPQGRWYYQKNPKAFAAHPKPFKFHFDKMPSRLEAWPRCHLIVGPFHSNGQVSRKYAVDVVFPALHGPMGEDGTLQGYLELLNAPYVGCGVLGSAVGMDKAVTKRLAREAGLPVLPYAVIEGRCDLSRARRLRFPVFVKPARLGSSVGVYKVKAKSQLASAVRRAFRFDTTVIVEQGIPAREVECAVLGGGGRIAASPVGEIRPTEEFYSYHAKYLNPNGAEFFIPAKLSARQAKRVRDYSVRAFRTLGCYGCARVDFLMDRKTGKIWFNEANTLPGFTSLSMYPNLWKRAGLSFSKLLDRLIALALERHSQHSRLRITRD